MIRSLILVLAAATAVPAAAQDRAPEVTRKGRTVVMYKDAKLEAVLGFRWMNANPAATWVPLQFAISGSSDGNVDVAREDVSLVTPSGERIPLPGQEAFRKGVRNPDAILHAVSVARDPIAGYFPGRFHTEPLSFFVVQEAGRPMAEARGRGGLAWDHLTVDRNTLAIGLLWFPLPAGVQQGRYHLQVQSKWAHVDIPFDVPAPPLSKGSTDEGVSW